MMNRRTMISTMAGSAAALTLTTVTRAQSSEVTPQRRASGVYGGTTADGDYRMLDVWVSLYGDNGIAKHAWETVPDTYQLGGTELDQMIENQKAPTYGQRSRTWYGFEFDNGRISQITTDLILQQDQLIYMFSASMPIADDRVSDLVFDAATTLLGRYMPRRSYTDEQLLALLPTPSERQDLGLPDQGNVGSQ